METKFSWRDKEKREKIRQLKQNGNTYPHFQKNNYNCGGTSVACIDLSGKEPHSQAGVGSVVTSGSLGGITIGTLTQNGRAVGSIPALEKL